MDQQLIGDPLGNAQAVETLIEAAPMATTVLDLEGRVLVWNRAAEEMYGWTAAEVLGQPLKIIPADAAHEHAHIRERLLRGETVRGVESRRVRKDGRIVISSFSGSPLRNADGQIYAMVGVHVDVTSQRTADASLRQERDFNAAIIETVGALVVVLDPYGRIERFNSACEKATGYLQSEVVGRFFFELFRPPEDWAAVRASLETLRAGGPPMNAGAYEREWFTKDGGRRRIIWTNAPLRHANGALRCFIGTGIDITEQRRAEAALRAIEAGTSRATGAAFFENLVEQLASVLGVRCAMLAETDGQLLKGRTLANWDNGPAPSIEYRLAGTPCSITVQEGVCFYADGVAQAFPEDPILAEMGLQSYMGARLRDSKGRPIGLLALMHDGPMPDVELARSLLLLFSGRAEAELERLQADSRAARLHTLLQQMIDSMPSVLAGVDTELNVTHWNLGAEEMTGAPATDVLGRSLFDALPALREWSVPIRAALAASQIFRRPRMTWCPRGQRQLADLTMYPLIGGDRLSAVVRLDDVTDRTRMEEAIIQSDKMMSIGGLAAGMAHEINNPLAGMMQSAQVIANRLGEDIPANRTAAEKSGISLAALKAYSQQRELPELLSGIRETGQRAARIIDNMLRFSRKDGSPSKLCDLNGLIENTLEIARSDYDLRKQYDFQAVELERRLSPNLPRVACQQTEIQQVLLNILRNASEAMAEQKTPGRTPRIEVETAAEQDWVRIDIKDNGPGMTEDVRRHVFEPFFTTKAAHAGTGLGLSVSYFIITENHGGSLTVDSEPGQGTCFTIRLPLTQEGREP